MARKIIDAIEESLQENRRFFALEFFPPKTTEGESNLYPRMEKLSRQLQPLWCGMTCSEQGTTAEQTLSIGHTAQSILSIDMQLNITAGAMNRSSLRAWLEEARRCGIRNLMLLRGISAPRKDADFQGALDLVRFVRDAYADFFCVAVAGHPEGYDGDVTTYQQAIADLKEKVDAGADLVVTSMIFHAPSFLKFCADCRDVGIRCPIVPGVMPVQSRAQFRHWLNRPGCESLREQVENLAHRYDDAEVKRLGVIFVAGLLKQLFRGGVRGAYFFTMNMETVVTQIVEATGLAAGVHKELPWRQSTDPERSQKESQRPIYWSGRPSSYMVRTRATSATDDFPNGRYGDAMSPAFGENTTYHTALALTATARLCHWMFAAKNLRDVCDGFLNFLAGHGRLPWCEESLAPEADVLLESTLKPLNRRGLLTINSQPAANGLPSEDSQCGWGPPNGFVYQKQYLEFFCSRANLQIVSEVFRAHESLAFMALDCHGDVVERSKRAGLPRRSSSIKVGCSSTSTVAIDDGDETTAVTWGVFPNRPILQPTVVSLAAFRAWAPEAFQMWRLPFAMNPSSGAAQVAVNAEQDRVSSPTCATHVTFNTAALAAEGDLPRSMPPVLREIAREWVLVSVVDNDYVNCPTALDRATSSLCAILDPISD